jgi:hypothetical protein
MSLSFDDFKIYVPNDFVPRFYSYFVYVTFLNS